MPTSPHRHPGAPLGNFNALKHGFYTKRIRKRDFSGVETTELKSLANEIALIRDFIQRLVATCQSSSDSTRLMDVVRTLCLASSTITRILRIQYLLTGIDNDPERDFNNTVLRTLSEMAAKPPLPSQPHKDPNTAEELTPDSLPSMEDK
jgi:hypothetical protein